MITDSFDVVPGETYIEFPYDWRRDNRVAARRLQRVVDEKLHAQRQRNPDAKLILIGHSMGGLVARYFLECLDGWQDTRMLITFGTPHRGSLNAARLPRQRVRQEARPAEGRRPDRAAALADVRVPAAADLPVRGRRRRLPTGRRDRRSRCPASITARADARADDFHRAIEAGAAAHEPAAYAIHSVVGITQGTKQSAALDGDRLVIAERHDGEDMGGDGTCRGSRRRRSRPTTAPGVPADVLLRATAPCRSPTPCRPSCSASSPPGRSTGFRGRAERPAEADELLAAGESLVVRALPDAAGLTLRARSPTSPPAGRRAHGHACAVTPTRCTRRAAAAAAGRLPPAGRGRRRRRRWPTRSTRSSASSTTCPDIDPGASPRRMTDERRRRVYALLVGIDAYLPPINPLYGCRNDIAALEHVPAGPRRRRARLRMLHDAEATRDAVVGGVPRAPRPSRAGDVALFAYAGHGSEEPAPAEIADLEPTGRIQTLMLHDCGRRIDGKLRAGPRRQGAQPCSSPRSPRSGAHVAVVLDCCHSGGGTRDPFARVPWLAPGPSTPAPEEHRDLVTDLGTARPLADFLPGALDGWAAPDRPAHVALAACRSHETAKEHRVGDVTRGAFSVALVESLTSSAAARHTARCSPPSAPVSSARRRTSGRSCTRSTPAAWATRCSSTAP